MTFKYDVYNYVLKISFLYDHKRAQEDCRSATYVMVSKHDEWCEVRKTEGEQWQLAFNILNFTVLLH